VKLYSCKVRLSGSLYNEVPKTNVTASEVYIFRLLHGGDDAVTALVETGSVKRSQAEERDRLAEEYGPGLANFRQLRESPEQAMNAVFGMGGRLPDDLPGVAKAAKAAPAPVAEPDEPEENPEE
jgi:hypothetical protein